MPLVALSQMYERMGDALALQYGGSQMHRQMKHDKNKSLTMAPVLGRTPQITKSKEMLVSLMRHYQNSFQVSRLRWLPSFFLKGQ
jgi:hypothetical protein